MAGLVVETRIGRKGAIYIPKNIMQVLGVKEGDKVIIRVEDGRLVLEFIPDPFTLAVDIRVWAETSVEEFEKESEEEQVAWED